jgi:hypothetical protein
LRHGFIYLLNRLGHPAGFSAVCRPNVFPVVVLEHHPAFFHEDFHVGTDIGGLIKVIANLLFQLALLGMGAPELFAPSKLSAYTQKAFIAGNTSAEFVLCFWLQLAQTSIAD